MNQLACASAVGGLSCLAHPDCEDTSFNGFSTERFFVRFWQAAMNRIAFAFAAGLVDT